MLPSWNKDFIIIIIIKIIYIFTCKTYAYEGNGQDI